MVDDKETKSLKMTHKYSTYESYYTVDITLPYKELILGDDYNWYGFRHPQMFIECLKKLEKEKERFDKNIWYFLRYETGWWNIFHILDIDKIFKIII